MGKHNNPITIKVGKIGETIGFANSLDKMPQIKSWLRQPGLPVDTEWVCISMAHLGAKDSLTKCGTGVYQIWGFSFLDYNVIRPYSCHQLSSGNQSFCPHWLKSSYAQGCSHLLPLYFVSQFLNNILFGSPSFIFLSHVQTSRQDKQAWLRSDVRDEQTTG